MLEHFPGELKVAFLAHGAQSALAGAVSDSASVSPAPHPCRHSRQMPVHLLTALRLTPCSCSCSVPWDIPFLTGTSRRVGRLVPQGLLRTTTQKFLRFMEVPVS